MQNSIVFRGKDIYMCPDNLIIIQLDDEKVCPYCGKDHTEENMELEIEHPSGRRLFIHEYECLECGLSFWTL
jgi:hypothetical protein